MSARQFLAKLLVSCFLLFAVSHTYAGEGLVEEDAIGLPATYFTSAILGSVLGTNIIVKEVLPSHLQPLTTINGVQYYRPVNVGSYFIKTIGGGMLVAYGAATVGGIVLCNYSWCTRGRYQEVSQEGG